MIDALAGCRFFSFRAAYVGLTGHGALRAARFGIASSPGGGTDEPEHRTEWPFGFASTIFKAIGRFMLIQSLPPSCGVRVGSHGQNGMELPHANY